MISSHHYLRERLLQCLRSRRGQAGAPDQLVLPQPRRGHVRRVPAADGRHRLQELPRRSPRASRRRQDQVPVPLETFGSASAAMTRILLGVSGGIAAHKALELVRLATAAGHAVRVVQTPGRLRFVGTASFAALTGAPVLTDEFERYPGARGVPRPAGARPRPAVSTSSSSATPTSSPSLPRRRTRSPSSRTASPTTS